LSYRKSKLLVNIPERFLAQRNRLLSYVGTGLLSVTGWKVTGQIPDMKKLLVILAPHTSNWDFVYGMAMVLSLKIKIYWLGKHSIFKKGVTRLLKSLGGIPVNRNDSKNIINDVLDIANREGGILIGLSPEGTRKKAEKWKSGFLRIAQSMECPILLVAIDYPSKEISFRELFYPTGDNQRDIEYLKKYYKDFMGKIPEHF
jgi:1-acyl-sn-glycerol-3-phosphate acyltransferase|tara:strand:- start:1110 stop:1712 length:603 start_codon:yes stop_codon:yes gene_type:complete